MLDLHIIESGQNVPVVALPGLLGSRRAARMVGDTIEELIAFMDRLDGDPDLEDGHDAEAYQGDERDVAWAEWHCRRSRTGEFEPIGARGTGEDDEDDDPAEDDDPREEDDHAGGNVTDEPHDDDDPAGGENAEDDFDLRYAAFGMRGPGCPISDPGGCEHNGCEMDNDY